MIDHKADIDGLLPLRIMKRALFLLIILFIGFGPAILPVSASRIPHTFNLLDFQVLDRFDVLTRQFTVLGWEDKVGWERTAMGLTTKLNSTTVSPNDVWLKYNGSGIKVAIIDTGTNSSIQDLNHVINLNPDLPDPSCDSGFDYWAPSFTHGTMVASTLTSRKDGQGMVGVAYGNSVFYSINVEYKSRNNIFPWITDCSLAKGIKMATSLGVDIISMSLGAELSSCSDPQLTPELVQSMDMAYNAGILMVAGAGNSNNSPWGTQAGKQSNILCPANYPKVVAVGAVGRDQCSPYVSDGICRTYKTWTEKSDFSSWGPELDVMAPGWSVTVLDKKGAIIKASGTSFSTPLASGYFAMLLQRGLSRDQILGNLFDFTLRESGNYNVYYGLGLLHASLIDTILTGTVASLRSLSTPIYGTIFFTSFSPLTGTSILGQRLFISSQSQTLRVVVSTSGTWKNSFSSFNMTWAVVGQTNTTLAFNLLGISQTLDYSLNGQAYIIISFSWIATSSVFVDILPYISYSFITPTVGGGGGCRCFPI